MGYLRFLEKAAVNDYNLYHVTNLTKLYSIINTNTLRLSLSETNENESRLGKSKLYYISFARTPSSGYIADRGKSLRTVNESALIIFDKNKLIRKRGVTLNPVQYFGLDFKGRLFGEGAREAEERLFSDNMEIPNVIPAIKEIRIMTYGDSYPVPNIAKKLLIILKRKKLNVKLFTMNNFQGYLHGREKEEDRLEAFNNLKVSKYEINKYTPEARRAKQITKKNPKWGALNTHMSKLEEYVYKTDKEELSAEARLSLYYHVRYPEAFFEAYKSEIHNLRSSIPLDKIRFDRLLRKMKAKSVKDFFNKLYNKWNSQ